MFPVWSHASDTPRRYHAQSPYNNIIVATILALTVNDISSAVLNQRAAIFIAKLSATNTLNSLRWYDYLIEFFFIILTILLTFDLFTNIKNN